MASKWNHLMCGACWHKQFGEREAARMLNEPMAPCCFCNVPTASGIYIRRDPALVGCEGKHE